MKNRLRFLLLLFMLASFTLLSCKAKGKESSEKRQSISIGVPEKENLVANKNEKKVNKDKKEKIKGKQKFEKSKKQLKKIEDYLEFLDAYKVKHKAKIDTSLKMHPYDLKKFKRDGDKLFYEDETYTSKLGIDVSHHQRNIDWKKVRDYGIYFAFIRIGARGYGKEGSLIIDKEYEKNIKEAKKQGIKVGIYFYSQALNEAEATEEANFVLKLLKGERLDLPIIYDPEHALEDNGKKNVGRNAKVKGEQSTKNTLVFFKKMEKEGYQCGVYSNMMWQAYEYDMKKIEKYPMWYADYEKNPQTPYMFEYWQYFNKANVPGISGNTDMNIWLIKK